MSENESISAAEKNFVKPRRVLIIVENLPVPFDRRVWAEATALVRHGYQVSVICPKGKNAEASYEFLAGVHIYRHPMPLEARGAKAYLVEYGSALFWEFLLSLKVFFTRGFDVLEACNPPDLLFPLGLFYKLFGKRFVFDHHDISPELYEGKFNRRGLFWKLLVLFEKLTFRTADFSIATNESYRRLAIARGAMAPERVFVVRNGPDLTRVTVQPAEPRWKNNRRFMVAYVGVIAQQEGLDLLLETVAYLVCQRGRTDIQFVIVGSGPDQQSIVRLAQEAGLSDYVSFPGRVDDPTLLTILSTADLCVNPDRPNAMNDQSTMIKIMEYMALGKPIVQYDLTEGRFSAQQAALYARKCDTADFGDKILTILDEPALARRMGAFGLERVRTTLAWEHQEKKLLAAYEAIFTS
jgi:glycosyltransferase involved in cell wall biosynthesis